MPHPLSAGNVLLLAGAPLFTGAEIRNPLFVTLDKNLADCAEAVVFCGESRAVN